MYIELVTFCQRVVPRRLTDDEIWRYNGLLFESCLSYKPQYPGRKSTVFHQSVCPLNGNQHDDLHGLMSLADLKLNAY